MDKINKYMDRMEENFESIKEHIDGDNNDVILTLLERTKPATEFEHIVCNVFKWLFKHNKYAMIKLLVSNKSGRNLGFLSQFLDPYSITKNLKIEHSMTITKSVSGEFKIGLPNHHKMSKSKNRIKNKPIPKISTEEDEIHEMLRLQFENK